jgi:hypothetical protein
MKRPVESDYTSHVAYTRALEEYCDVLEQPAPVREDWGPGPDEYHSLPPAAQPAPVQKPVAWLSETGSVWSSWFKDTDKPLYTTPPATQRKPSHKEFMEWAGKEGYDTAYTINLDTGKFIAHSPMTADLWKAWQAAHSIKENT